MKISHLIYSYICIGVILVGTACFANIIPNCITDIPATAMGVYQTDKRLTIYEKPMANSKILIDKEIDFSNDYDKKQDDFFAVVIPQKSLGYLYVTDVSDDECWVEVIYDKTSGAKGWVYKNDEFQFMPWGNFITLYGRKYGLNLLKTGFVVFDSNIYSAPDNDSQVLGTLTRTKYIHLTTIEGRWALVSVLDYSGNTTTGYIKWQSDDGHILLFPEMK